MGDYVNVKELFGCDVFNDSVMQDRLPKKVLQRAEEKPLKRARSFPWRLQMWLPTR